MASDTSTVIGETILVNGNLSGDEDLLVLGKVEGSISLTKTLHVQESGVVKANVQVKNAIISGIVVGNIQASDSIEITEQGRMVGDIKAPRVIIVEGASFRGNIDMGDLEAQRPSGPLPVRSEPRPASLRPASRPALGAGSMSARPPAPAAKPAARPEPAKAEAKEAPKAPAAPARPAAPAAPAGRAPAAPPKPPPAVVTAGKKKVVVKKS